MLKKLKLQVLYELNTELCTLTEINVLTRRPTDRIGIFMPLIFQVGIKVTK